METTVLEKKKTSKLEKEKLLKKNNKSFRQCHHCGNKKLKYIEKHKFIVEEGAVPETHNVFLCPTCNCTAWETEDFTYIMFWPGITNIKKWEEEKGIIRSDINWISDQDLANRKN